MNNTLPLLILFLFSSVLSAQFEWEELPPHNAEHIQVIHYTEDDRLIGFLQYGTALYVSDDLGTSWDLLATMDVLANTNFIYDGQIAEKSDGTLFTIVGDIIYEINESEKNLDFFLEPDMFFSPDDLFFLEDGKVIVGNIDDLQLYGSSGNLISTREIDEGSFNANLIKGEDDIHYYHSARGLIKFNSDLTIIEEDITASVFSGTGSFVLDNEGRIYSNSFYSPDGMSWNEYPNGIFGKPTLTAQGHLHLLGWNSLHISQDGGQSFESYQVEAPLAGVANLSTLANSYPYGDAGIIYSLGRCPGALIISENGLDNWEEKTDNLLIGAPYSFDVEAVSDGFVLAENCNSADTYLRTNGNSWGSLPDQDPNNFSCGNFRTITSFPDGSLFTDEGCRSTDEGVTWEETTVGFLFDPLIYITANGAYILDFQEVYRSTDNGESWEAFQFEPAGAILPGVDPATVSISENVYMISPIGDGVIFRHSLDGELVDVIAAPIQSSFTVSLAASFNRPQVFALLDIWNEAPQLMVYGEDDKSRVLKPLPSGVILDYPSRLVTDQGENLYLITQSRLFLSPDGGDNWENITPVNPSLKSITDIDVGWDGYLYVATHGTPILKSASPVVEGHNTMNVIVYLDENGDCNYDANNEENLSGLRVEIGNFHRQTNEEGRASFNLRDGSNELRLDARDDLYEICDYNEIVEFSGFDEEKTVFIGVQLLAECADLSISSTTPFLRRCFDNTYYIEIYNDGSAAAENTIAFLELDEHFDFISSDFSVISQSGQTVALDIGRVEPRDAVRGKLEFNLSCDAELGQAHYMNATLEYEIPCDENSRVIEAFECRENIGSYDPNDKSVYIDGVADTNVISQESEIEYLIRFQNTGTDTAFTVRIEDGLSADFDFLSLYPVVASHDYEWELNRNNLIVTFNNILLPDSTVNEPDSHGFIKFRVELTDDRPQPGDLVENTAEIYFDFNEPIITNTVQTSYLCQHTTSLVQASICPGEEYEGYTQEGTYEDLLVTDLGCDSLRTLEVSFLTEGDELCITSTTDPIAAKLIIYPVPTQDLINMSYQGNKVASSYSLLNLNGQLVKKANTDRETRIEVGELAQGIYLLQLLFDDGSTISRRVSIVR